MTPERFAAELRTRAGTARLLVGIAGEPGSGKSTLARRTAEALGADAVVLPMDGFHLPQARLVELGRRERMGAPDTFDVAGFVRLLGEVRADAGPVDAPGFDREVEEAVPGAIRIDPGHRIVLVEGNYLLHDEGGWEAVAPLLDVTAFVRVDEALRIARLIRRHHRFGKTPAAAHAWATGPDEANAAVIRRTADRAELQVAVD
ncbi:nucleoside/nucleotide kinase family protein [Protaetiibacter intestinalis]|uniref:Nucleoside/nucleotide kinase family protein n=1 Tax=Protaetiibacter intestinalis TaxID=2419774 RepID=A0A387B956_9MICO|nr:nucleoside/nucleotide kinase family protein [Protaetiibacter intestinalis]AYF97715.1 nucleoside/nucleotide kinase family protein [Protaetiibacter intestinalis]